MPGRGEDRERGDWYRRPAWYDIVHAAGTAREVDGLQRIARRFAPRATRWLEPACGTARHLRVLARRGVAVEGFDALPEMVAYARARMARTSARRSRRRIFQADMTDFTLARPAHFAFCTINTIRHLMTDRDLLDHLACMARALAPGGVYAVGLNTHRYGVEFETEDLWAGARGPCKVTQAVQYLPPPDHDDARGRRPDAARRETVVNHLIVQTPSGTRHLDSVYHLRTYSLEEWRRVIQRSPMRIAGVVDEDGRDLAPFDRHGPTEAPPGGYAIQILTPRE